MGKYDDIINMKYTKSSKHIPMSMHNRAAQFSPFAALSGYDVSIEEAGRITDKREILSEDAKRMLDEALLEIKNGKNRRVVITYFEKDSQKDGGAYKKISGVVKKIDEFNRSVVLRGGEVILIDDIYDISEDDFGDEE